MLCGQTITLIIMSSVKPITPEQARGRKDNIIPDIVIESFNKLIVDNLTITGKASFKKDAVLEEIISRGMSKKVVYDNNYLDIELLYKKFGWKVQFNSPSWDESYDDYFVFVKNTN
jgi:hypothetical protein